MANYGGVKADLSLFSPDIVEAINKFKNKDNEKMRKVLAKVITLNKLLNGVTTEFRIPIDQRDKILGVGLWWKLHETSQSKLWQVVLEDEDGTRSLKNCPQYIIMEIEPYLDKLVAFVVQKIKSVNEIMPSQF